ncbi:hypothetical protein EXIGLDRAFT_333064 [Exidia glandulosa HHB12029]|uniref:Methyltransferase domain-containing protein n=1 Tax=Exidia glandulosa HHB12029 TaxID=1314781 RepID=A0A165LM40_EXIGL|nr:hypothetical protein EXIGLDRAFT_333064 [Exidia glandulosa HHB12029]
MAQITRELPQPPVAPPELDELLFNPKDDELEFLRSAISKDEAELRRRVVEVQRDEHRDIHDEGCANSHAASAVYPYPCLRGFHHVALMMSRNPIYPEVLQSGVSLGEDTLFLDLGCCMGTDVRKLAADGYPSSRILGCDLRQIFLDLGHKLYRDSESGTCPIHFFTSDIFAVQVPLDLKSDPGPLKISDVQDLSQLAGRVRHIYTGALFHLFDEETQKAIALRLALLLMREPGSVIFGRHQGLRDAGYIDDHLGRLRYGHSPLSWPAMWRTVFEEVAPQSQLTLEIQAELAGGPQGLVQPMQGQLVWSVKIVTV